MMTLLLLSALCMPAASALNTGNLPDGVPQTLQGALEYYSHKRIGIQTGTSLEEAAKECFPEAEFYYFSSAAELKNALLHEKLDAFVFDEPGVLSMCREDNSIAFYDEKINYEDMAFAFNKETGAKLCSQFNSFFENLEKTGEADALREKWFNPGDDTEVSVDIDSLPDTNGTLMVVSDIAFAPFEYYKDNKPAGYDVELLALFAREYGYALQIENVKFSSVVASISTGKADIAASGLSITDERKESVLFSDVVYRGGGVLCVRSANTESESIFGRIAGSFVKTFVKEERWKMFLNGILLTVAITFTSAAAGTVLGFLLFSFCRKGSSKALKITNFFSWLIHGMPAVVLLLIMYYIVFGKSSVNGVFVSIVSFSILFAFDVCDLMLQGNRAIDKGQTEAAYMLGYTDRKAFYKIILPQLIIFTIPGYIGAIVSLLKSTAIVGYIAVEDITKMSDIISSRTYEAFFPLIVTAIMYFVIAWIPQKLLKNLQKKIDPLLKSQNADKTGEAAS